MATVGYSGTPLIKKLGIQPEMKVLVINKPDAYFVWLGADITDQFVAKNDTPDFIHLFAKDMATFKKEMVSVLKFCKKNTSAIVWISWYKKSAGIATDLSENLIRDFALQNDLVDVKVCAVSEEWSGLKLVVPVSKR
ncbi:MAG: hypothetical protein JNM14_10250 [Ferruginibacter sp.]|nr:hypothetical protein [Ferruginibacter sp.]